MRSIKTLRKGGHSYYGKFSERAGQRALWEQVATKWPILEDVYALPRINKEVDSQGQHVFLTEELASNVSLIDFQASNLDRRPSVNRVTRIRELLTVDFVAQDGGHQASYGQNYHYSTNYQVFEGIVGNGDANHHLIRWRRLMRRHASVAENSRVTAATAGCRGDHGFDEFQGWECQWVLA